MRAIVQLPLLASKRPYIPHSDRVVICRRFTLLYSSPSAPRRRSAAAAGATLCARFGRHCGAGSLSASNIPPPVRRRGGHYQISFVIKANRLLCDIRPRTCLYELRRKYMRGAECGVNKRDIDATGGNKKGARCQLLIAGLGNLDSEAVLRLVALPAKNEQDITRTDNHYT